MAAYKYGADLVTLWMEDLGGGINFSPDKTLSFKPNASHNVFR
mgnify:CR=1 FL=1|jgi:hypothetical protein